MQKRKKERKKGGQNGRINERNRKKDAENLI